MSEGSQTLRRRLAFAGMLATLVAAFMLIYRLTVPGLPTGPVDVAWDKEACAHCRMRVGDPRFAAQLHTIHGAVLSFDDAGCLLERMALQSDDVHAVYFHAQHTDEWIASGDVGFVTGQATPMGFGLGAARNDGRQGLVDFATVLARARARVAELRR